MKKILLLTAFIILFAGCSSVPKSAPLTGDAAQQFFNPAVGIKATAYFTCGKWYTKSWLGDSENDSPFCDFLVNSTGYSRIEKNMVGRIELLPGRYQIKQVEESMGVSIPTEVELGRGDVILFTANYTHRVGALGGAMTGNHLFTVELLKNDVLAKIRTKMPVAMTAVAP